MAYIETKGLNKQFKQGEADVFAVKDVSLTIKKGKSTAIIGKSGSGKSTLLHLLGQLLTPTSGQILLEGQPIEKISDTKKAQMRNKLFGYIIQDYALVEEETIFENVRIPLLYAENKLSKKEQRDKVSRLLEQVDLTGMLDYKVNRLSGGQRQRVAICRSIVNDAEIILADEPTGELDTENSEKIFSLLHGLTKQGKTLVMVTHNIDLANRCDQVYRMQDGILISKFE